MKSKKTIYYIFTALLSIMMILSSGMYLFNNEEVVLEFQKVGFPTYIIYPLAFFKIAGLIVLWFVKNKSLKEWAYAGFFFNFLLALSAHINVNDGDFPGAIIALVLLAGSYFSYKKLG
ncbi:MAG: DoxX family protein [Flavobacteriales bacterium]